MTPLSNHTPSVMRHRAAGSRTPTARARRRAVTSTGLRTDRRFTTRIGLCSGLRNGDMTSWWTRVGDGALPCAADEPGCAADEPVRPSPPVASGAVTSGAVSSISSRYEQWTSPPSMRIDAGARLPSPFPAATSANRPTRSSKLFRNAAQCSRSTVRRIHSPSRALTGLFGRSRATTSFQPSRWCSAGSMNAGSDEPITRWSTSASRQARRVHSHSLSSITRRSSGSRCREARTSSITTRTRPKSRLKLHWEAPRSESARTAKSDRIRSRSASDPAARSAWYTSLPSSSSGARLPRCWYTK